MASITLMQHVRILRGDKMPKQNQTKEITKQTNKLKDNSKQIKGAIFKIRYKFGQHLAETMPVQAHTH